MRGLHQKVLKALLARSGDLACTVQRAATLAEDRAAVLEYAPRAAKEVTGSALIGRPLRIWALLSATTSA